MRKALLLVILLSGVSWGSTQYNPFTKTLDYVGGSSNAYVTGILDANRSDLAGFSGGSRLYFDPAAANGLLRLESHNNTSTQNQISFRNANGLNYGAIDMGYNALAGFSITHSSVARTITDGNPVNRWTASPAGAQILYDHTGTAVFTVDKGSVSMASFNATQTSFTITATAGFISSTHTILSEASATGNTAPNRGLLDIYHGNATSNGTTVLMSFGSNQQQDQVIIRDQQPFDLIRYGGNIGGLRVGRVGVNNEIYSDQAVTQYIHWWNNGTMEMKTATSGNGGKDIVLFPQQVEAMRVSNTGGVVVTSSVTVLSTAGMALGGPAKLKNYTVATLPAGSQGQIAYVTDATTPAFLATLVGGGAIVCPAFHNGTNWVAF